MLESIHIYFLFSSKNIKLQDVQNELELQNKSMAHLSDTCWVCRYTNCNVVINIFLEILQVLNE